MIPSNEWYARLTRPPLTPPDYVFGPVWTILYIMIAVAIILFIRQHKTHVGYGVLILIAFHLACNLAWTGIFFGLRSPGWALVDIVLLDITLGAIICIFWRTSHIASILLWPYLLWVLFATYLNIGFYLLNKP